MVTRSARWSNILGKISTRSFALSGDSFVIPRPAEPPVSTIDIFISHSSKDKALAEAFVELLKAAFSIRPDRIRATSIYGHKHTAGADENQLRDDTIGATLVVGLITDASIESAYVLFELGARWGTKKVLFPVLGAGASPAMLRGPLARMNALSCDSEQDLHQIISDAADVLHCKPNKAEAYVKHINSVVAASSTLKEGRQRASTATNTRQGPMRISSAMTQLVRRSWSASSLMRASNPPMYSSSWEQDGVRKRFCSLSSVPGHPRLCCVAPWPA